MTMDYRLKYNGGAMPEPVSNPDYSTYGQAISGAGMAATPFLPIAGFGLQAVGMGLGAYGAYKQSKQAERDYAAAMENYRQEQERQKRMDAEQLKQNAFQNNLASGQYATNQIKDVVDPYVQYARAMGR